MWLRLFNRARVEGKAEDSGRPVSALPFLFLIHGYAAGEIFNKNGCEQENRKNDTEDDRCLDALDTEAAVDSSCYG